MKSKKRLKENYSSKKATTKGDGSSESDPQQPPRNFYNESRRSSTRIRNQQQSISSKNTHSGLADSAYDADEESLTPNSSPEQNCTDPYEINMMEYVPVVTHKVKKATSSAPKKRNKPKQMSKQRKKSGHGTEKSTSTPVILTENVKPKNLDLNTPESFSVTPEVTPILPIKPHESGTSQNESFVTPQIRRSARKRSLQPESFQNISTHISYSSQGDSGIGMSPVSKKQRVVSDLEISSNEISSELELNNRKRGKKTLCENKGMKMQMKSTSSVFGRHCMNKKNIFSPKSQPNAIELLRTKGLSKGSPNSIHDNCFGFDSIGSPVFNCENSPPPKQKQPKRPRAKGNITPPKDTYRSQLSDSDVSPSSVTKKLGLSVASESSPEDVNRIKSTSPTLFSDVFSDGSGRMELEVNKSSCKVYKPLNISKMKKMKPKQTASELDRWATNFNMEIEDIEKFDLNIE